MIPIRIVILKWRQKMSNPTGKPVTANWEHRLFVHKTRRAAKLKDTVLSLIIKVIKKTHRKRSILPYKTVKLLYSSMELVAN